MKTIQIILLIFIFSLMSCKDIIDTEPVLEKKLLSINQTPEDTLNQLTLPQIDLGIVKMMSVSNQYISIVNTSNEVPVTIYSIKAKNTSGLFSYSYPSGFPFDIMPLEDTQKTQKFKLKFIADVLAPGIYTDTLVINNNASYFIPVKVNVLY